MSDTNETPETPPANTHVGAPSYANQIVRAALNQPFLVAIFALTLIGTGIWSFYRLPVDAYPDLSPPMVSVTTQWPGHAAERSEERRVGKEC